ncbi:hypothetical protein RHD99_05400 [Buttiauxella selenatireducens]|uniref:Uncharacterized protein n=1 Tax=Buttiauxella selenatireducens TaxID=3073902 RepID=A0ABY9SG61_9ENTR|nr:hypothetical protein [Buttiauxella sp. R73]WMY75396.1 hypothetical protein RHD99_05400 [Buttiauxella sp. R73]
MTKSLEALIAKIKKQTESFDNVILKEDEAKALIAALEQAQQRSEEQGRNACELLDEVNQQRQRIAELESQPHHNGMMQLSNELAEMKRKCAVL